MSTTLSIAILILCASGIGIWFGYKIGRTPIPIEELEKIQQKAFEEAKQEYTEFFHKNFDPKGRAVLNNYTKALIEENKALLALNKEFEQELNEWRRKNNENTRSN